MYILDCNTYKRLKKTVNLLISVSVDVIKSGQEKQKAEQKSSFVSRELT